MSSGLAIASITAILKNLLEDGLVQSVALSSMGNVLVTTLPPDQISVGVDGQPQLNLFMYQVSQNRNADWQGCDRNHPNHHQASTLDDTNPPLAINLHYLLTAYGAKDYQTELLLGYAMELMHQTPVVSGDTIKVMLKHIASINRTGFLAQALESTSVTDLVEQLGQVQITPDLFGAEQMSRLWSLLQSAYRPSVAYEVSMVFIDAQKPIAPSSTMTEEYDAQDSVNKIASSPELAHQPHIEKVVASPSTDELSTARDLILYGRNLLGEVTQLCLNGEQNLLEPKIVEHNRILFCLPQHLQNGVQTIQVVHHHKFINKPAIVSNKQTFTLHSRCLT
jgi:hypothetical protein